jgi:hypothetical protein
MCDGLRCNVRERERESIFKKTRVGCASCTHEGIVDELARGCLRQEWCDSRHHVDVCLLRHTKVWFVMRRDISASMLVFP